MRGKHIVSVLGIVALCSGARGIEPASSAELYGKIPERNLFGLHDPVQPTNEPVKPQLPSVKLQGIATVPAKLAFLKTQPLTKPGEQPQSEQSYTLGEGQREGGIEVLEINEKTSTIRLKNAGTEMTVGFDKDAGKVASTPPPGPVSSRVPPNIGAKIRSLNPGVSGYQRMTPTRTGEQVPPQSQAPSAQTPAQPLIQQPNAPAEKPMTPEEQAILKELEQQAAQAAPAQPR